MSVTLTKPIFNHKLLSVERCFGNNYFDCFIRNLVYFESKCENLFKIVAVEKLITKLGLNPEKDGNRRGGDVRFKYPATCSSKYQGLHSSTI